MSPKAYYSVTGTVFLIVAIVHLLRALNGWVVSIHTLDVSIWASWVSVVVAGYLAYNGLKRR